MSLSSSSSSLGKLNCWLAILCAGCVVILWATPARAQESVAGYIQCSVQGDNLNEGDTPTNPTRIDWGEIISILESALVEMNQDGSSPGSFQHAGVMVVKPLSKSSVRYMDALYQKSTLDTCVLEILDVNAQGQEYVKYTLELTNAKVGQIDIQGSGEKILEEITFHASELDRTWTAGSVTSSQNLSVSPS